MDDRLGVFQPDKFHPRMRVLRRDALVPEVERDPVAARLADHTRQNDGGLLVFEVGEVLCVPKIPKQRGAGAAFVRSVLGVKRKSGCAATHDNQHRQPGGFDVGTKRCKFVHHRLPLGQALGRVVVVEVAIVEVQPCRFDARQLVDEFVKCDGRLAKRNAGAPHAAIEVEQNRQGDAVGLRGAGQVADRLCVVGDG